ncbi:MAG: hypothetical protein Q7K40_05815 [bacterium]|nr:hypothetical protein [bacterium]
MQEVIGLRPPSLNTNFRNQCVLFLKPEATALSDGVNVQGIIDIIACALEDSHVVVGGVRILNGAYLKNYNIMDAHYGVINQISRLGIAALSDDAKKRLAEQSGGEERLVFGGHQFLERFSDFSPFALNVLSDSVGTKKLGGGTYYIPARVGGEHMTLLNPFHPHQLCHFTTPNRAIIVLECLTDTSWKDIRQDLIGATNPSVASVGSIRQILLQRQQELGMAEVSQGVNGVHLSAGPLEGMVEYQRFFSDHSNGKVIAYKNTLLGSELGKVGIPESAIASFASNCMLTINGRSLSSFDATEELDTGAVVKMLSDLPIIKQP